MSATKTAKSKSKVTVAGVKQGPAAKAAAERAKAKAEGNGKAETPAAGKAAWAERSNKQKGRGYFGRDSYFYSDPDPKTGSVRWFKVLSVLDAGPGKGKAKVQGVGSYEVAPCAGGLRRSMPAPGHELGPELTLDLGWTDEEGEAFGYPFLAHGKDADGGQGYLALWYGEGIKLPNPEAEKPAAEPKAKKAAK